MKQMTCAEMGGPAECTTLIQGNTPEEMVDNGMKHVTEAHPEMAAQLKAMSTEDGEKWMTDFKEKFAATPDMAA